MAYRSDSGYEGVYLELAQNQNAALDRIADAVERLVELLGRAE